jgi:hypothetical protein
MSGQVQNWRPETDGADYFLHQKKQLQVADRRPVIRRPSDLVGPGINSSAVRITDYNDALATFNGYYSSEPGASNAPNETDSFIGFVAMDDALGGKQIFTSLSTGEDYTRVFLRNPSDPSAILWGQWRPTEYQPPTLYSTDTAVTLTPDLAITPLTVPDTADFGTPDTFERVSTAVNILRPGVYSGYMLFNAYLTGYVLTNMFVDYPAGDTIQRDTRIGLNTQNGIYVPLHFWSSVTTGFLQVSIEQDTGSDHSVIWSRLSLSRIGEAPLA